MGTADTDGGGEDVTGDVGVDSVDSSGGVSKGGLVQAPISDVTNNITSRGTAATLVTFTFFNFYPITLIVCEV